jgi:hypothetical protein
MKTLARILFGTFIVAVVCAGFLAAALVLDPNAKEQRAFTKLFRERIHTGMPRPEVEQILGAAGYQGTDFHLGQREGFEHEYERARHSGASYFLFWGRRDTVYVVGFNSEDRVVITSFGGT